MKKIIILGKSLEQVKNALWYAQAMEAGIEISAVLQQNISAPEPDALYLVFYADGKNMAAHGVWCGEGCAPDGFEYSLEMLEEIPLWYLEMIDARKQGRPWVVYSGENYEFREMAVKDLPLLYELYDSKGVREYVEPLYPLAEETAFAQSYIQNMYGFYGYGLWLVFHKKTGELMGRVGFSHREIDGKTSVELGYIIGPAWQGQGYGAAICRKILELGFERWGIEEVFVCCDGENKRSIALARKLGFQSYGAAEHLQIFRYENGITGQKESG